MATMHNTKLGYGIEITAVIPRNNEPAYLKLKCGETVKKYVDHADASLTRQQQVMAVVKKFAEEELHSHSQDLNYTVVSLTGNRWVAVSIDTV